MNDSSSIYMVLTIPDTLLKDLHILTSQWSSEAGDIVSPCSRREASAGGDCSLSPAEDRVGLEPWCMGSKSAPGTCRLYHNVKCPSLPDCQRQHGYDPGWPPRAVMRMTWAKMCKCLKGSQESRPCSSSVLCLHPRLWQLCLSCPFSELLSLTPQCFCLAC